MNWENLDTPLIRFGDESEATAFTYRTSFNSVAVFGNTGSGKTSGVLAKLMSVYMQHGYGMLLLTSKPDDAEIYKRYAKQYGREQDIVEIKPGGKHAFNFMHYESTAKSELSFARSLQDVLNVVIQATEDRDDANDRDPFFRKSLQSLIKETIQLLLLAYNEVTIPELYAVAQSTPREKGADEKSSNDETAFDKAMKAAKDNVRFQLESWRQSIGDDYIQSLSDDEYQNQRDEAVPNYRVLKMVTNFFMVDLYNISIKTRGIILLSFTSFLSRLLDDPIYSLFCNKPSTCTPESCIEKGAIIIVNLPVSLYDAIGQEVQIMMKYIFQKAWQRRDLKKNGRPLAIIADEAQQFLHPKDATQLATSRSSRISTLYLSQNKPSFYANVSGDGKKAEAKIDALLSLLSTKIFLCNGCVDTNLWASRLIGEGYTEDVSTSANYGKDPSFGESSQFILEHMVRPEDFSKLRCGGEPDFKVEGYIHMQGVQFSNGFNHKKIKFTQAKNQ